MYKNFNWKGINIKQKRKVCEKSKFEDNHVKCNLIVPKFINKHVFIYNGKILTKLLVTNNMIGFKFGEFIRTRKEFSFKKKKGGAKN